ncbi:MULTISPECIES: DUF4157 domain-containing protein [unclassified Ruegeria]|uniref:eCIS core domain-containing protein n=1 Tax=unclassified Ruegeria TaxID=2625375 RepID=UPI0014899957|nr:MULTISPECIES: DUF4157 domain-containing protein [unclassified Ruegeria]
MKTEEAEKIVKGLKNKKAKTKAIKDEIVGTKATKLDKKLTESLGGVLGADLSGVRIHTGGNAADLCKALSAKAFTNGKDIFFAKSSDAKDKKLIAHELTHVVQQANGRMPKPMKGKVLVSK